MISNMQNINESELKKFNQLSQMWWDPEGPLKTLHQINPLRLQFIQETASLRDKTVLDVGCGGGILTESLSTQAASVVGLDMAEDVLSVARTHAFALSKPPTYTLATTEEYANQYPSQFEVITCMEMLEHVPDPFSIIKSLSTLLKPGGTLFCSTLNRNLRAYCQAIIGAEYILKMLPKGTHDYESFLRPSELVSMAKNAGLKLRTMKGIGYRFLNKSFYLSDDVRVNYLISFEKI
jgi:2-polyprenyl-6-hydroxyphenyl methylase/3-demethylubiquinone-9 3-methyltransferase